MNRTKTIRDESNRSTPVAAPAPAHERAITKRPRRLILPLSSGVNIFPGSALALTSRSQVDQLWPRRLLIKHADRWVVDRVRVNERTQLSQKIPGKTFAAETASSLLRLDVPLEAGENFDLIVRYVGPRAEGELFECCLFGDEQRDEPRGEQRDVSAIETESIDASSGKKLVRPHETAALVLSRDRRATGSRPFWPERLTIRDAPDWIVCDVQVRGKTLLVQDGDLPGVMFSGGANSPLICMGLLEPGNEILVTATYVGAREGGSTLACQLSGPRHEKDRSTDASTAILPMSTGVNILPYNSATITGRSIKAEPETGAGAATRGIPDGHAFRPRRVILDCADDWSINDVKIGVASQFAQTGDVPGTAFSPDVVDGAILFDPARPKIDVAITATFLGDSESGAPFLCGIAGDVIPARPS